MCSSAKCTISYQRLIVNLHFHSVCSLVSALIVFISGSLSCTSQLTDLCTVSDLKILLCSRILDQRTVSDQNMYSSKFRSLRPLTCVAQPLCASDGPKRLKPQPPPERNLGGIVTMRVRRISMCFHNCHLSLLIISLRSYVEHSIKVFSYTMVCLKYSILIGWEVCNKTI